MASNKTLRLTLYALLLSGVMEPAVAATCSWNAASGDWSVVANWSGCADAPGPSTRTPGPGDIALIASGAAGFDVDATVDEFEIGSGASLTLTGGGARFLTINTALRLNGGTLSTTGTGPFPFFQVVLAAGGTGQVLATSTLSNTVELENRGDLQLSSAIGTALNIRDLSRVINVAGSSFAIGGGDARVHLDGPVPLTVHADAILHTSGNVYIGKSIASTGSPRIESYGVLEHTGPGKLTVSSIAGGGQKLRIPAKSHCRPGDDAASDHVFQEMTTVHGILPEPSGFMIQSRLQAPHTTKTRVSPDSFAAFAAAQRSETEAASENRAIFAENQALPGRRTWLSTHVTIRIEIFPHQP